MYGRIVTPITNLASFFSILPSLGSSITSVSTDTFEINESSSSRQKNGSSSALGLAYNVNSLLPCGNR
jgi:hypothetical protein